MSRKPHSKLWLYFTGIIFATIFAVFALITAIWFALFELNLIQIDLSERHIPIVVLALGSILLGIVIAVYVGKLLVRPIQNISNAFNELSKGNFEIKVSEDEKIMENQEVVPNKTEYRLDEQLRKVILMLEGKWEPKNIEFDMELPRKLYYGSERLLEQVWSNILDNAIKHSPENSIIHVFMNTVDHAVEVIITDHGEGMTEDVKKHIFEKFYQGDPSRKSEGNGLGLPLVKRIVELCNGTVSVQSTIGRGTTFTVTLPL